MYKSKWKYRFRLHTLLVMYFLNLFPETLIVCEDGTCIFILICTTVIQQHREILTATWSQVTFRSFPVIRTNTLNCVFSNTQTYQRQTPEISCTWKLPSSEERAECNTHTHTHTHIYMFPALESNVWRHIMQTWHSRALKPRTPLTGKIILRSDLNKNNNKF